MNKQNKKLIIGSTLIFASLLLTGCSFGNTLNPAEQISIVSSSVLLTDTQNATLAIMTAGIGKDPTQDISSTLKSGEMTGYSGFTLSASDPVTTMMVQGTFEDYILTTTNPNFTGSIVYSSATNEYLNTLQMAISK